MERSGIFSALLENTAFTALDVGAAHWLPPHWLPYLNEFNYVLVEPDEEACRDLAHRVESEPRQPDRFRILQAVLSGDGARRSFFRLNCATGSSMLRPAISDEDLGVFFNYPKIDDPTYVYPLTEMAVDTVRLDRALDDIGHGGVHMVKLDTQGTELEILLGLGERLRDVVLVQMEAGDHGHYEGQPDLGRTLSTMREHGFRLVDIQLARSEMVLRGSNQAPNGYSSSLFTSTPGCDSAFVPRLHEVDAVFVRDPIPVAAAGDADGLRRIIVALCVYRLFGDAFQLTGIGEMTGLWDGLTARRYRRDIVRCHERLKRKLDAGYRLYWENV